MAERAPSTHALSLTALPGIVIAFASCRGIVSAGIGVYVIETMRKS